MNKLLNVEIKNYKINNKSILKDIALSLTSNEFVSIIGKNGAGKSSLLKLLAREVKDESIIVEISGKNIAEYSLTDLANKRSYLTQENNIVFDISVFELIEYGIYSRKNIDSASIIKEVLTLVGLEDKSDQNYNSLSGGEKQRAQIARVLAQIWGQKEIVLMLDEPMNNLDIEYQYKILEELKKIQKGGVGIIVIFHDLNLASKYSDKIILMNEGEIHSFATPQEVLTEKNLLEVFKHKMLVLKHPVSSYQVIISES